MVSYAYLKKTHVRFSKKTVKTKNEDPVHEILVFIASTYNYMSHYRHKPCVLAMSLHMNVRTYFVYEPWCSYMR